MWLLQIIWFCVFCAIYANDDTNLTDNDLSFRIFYGERANIKDYPYFAGIHGCGAAIISDQWLVTAAHCISNKMDKSVWVGGESIKNSQRYEFDRVIIHPQYIPISNYNSPVNDIALLRLSRPLTFGSTVKTIALPHREYQRNAVHKFVGRGRDEDSQQWEMAEHLMRVNLRTLATNECLSHLDANWRLAPHLMRLKKLICTKRIQDKPGVCHGDSGSPLVQKDTLVGLASFNHVKDCHASRIALFTNVALFVSWIKSVTGIN